MALILVVDDDPAVGKSLAHLLRARGYAALHVTDGNEALNAVVTDRPDVIVLDLHMPNMDGIEVLEVLRSYRRLRKLPVILYSGDLDDTAARRAERLAVEVIMEKGCSSASEVLEAVRDLLDHPAMRYEQ